jgi:hypothetical protein
MTGTRYFAAPSAAHNHTSTTSSSSGARLISEETEIGEPSRTAQWQIPDPPLTRATVAPARRAAFEAFGHWCCGSLYHICPSFYLSYWQLLLRVLVFLIAITSLVHELCISISPSSFDLRSTAFTDHAQHLHIRMLFCDMCLAKAIIQRVTTCKLRWAVFRHQATSPSMTSMNTRMHQSGPNHQR